TFEGLRDQVTADQLLSSEIINKDLFKKLKEGETSAEEVVSMDTVRKYLQGTGSIGGLLLPDSQEKISIYQAKRKGLLRPGTSLILLEAQAATGFVIDPATNKRYSVDEALRANVIGPDVYDKLLAAEKCVTGYRDPYSGGKISLFQAMQKELIVRDHGIRLLEAQIATGGIIDPVHSHRIPVEVAYKRGYFDKKMNLILSDPSDDTKGFFDPNTHENLTYLQLKEKCITEPSTGLCLLPLNSRKRQFVDEATRQVFRSSWLPVRFGRLRGEKVSVGTSLWELMHSGYFTEEQRSSFVERFRSEELSLEQLVALVLRLVGEMEMKARTQISLEGLRGSVPVVWLLDTGIISEKTFEELAQGVRTPEEVAAMESVRRYLKGTGSIAGVFIEASKQKMSFYDAMKNNLLLPGAALRLLEAQAATGYLTDPTTNRRLSVRDAVRAAVVGEELTEKLLLAERAVTGYTDPYTGGSISLCQALRKELVPLAEASHGIRLLEAQIATGGIIDPVHSHRVPVEVAYKRGYFNQEMNQILSDPSDDTKGFFDPNTHENLTYMQLLERCVQDPETGLYMLQVLEKEGEYFYIDEQTKNALMCTKVQVPVGKYKGQVLSLWELLCSEYVTEEKRKELVKKYKAESQHIVQGIIEMILKIIREKEEDRSDVWFQGIRQQITASELLSAKIITEETIEKLHEGKETAQEIAKMESVRRYLEGTGSIAGVLVPCKAQPGRLEKMSIYQAMWKGILRQGTALVLLEAQAATGFLIDPVKNQKLSVDEAVASGLVGSELKNKLLSAERAVTGYTHPYTGQKMSLFQAMKQELIVRDHGIRLLEAQIATGGIIDPVHSHRVPVEVAYKRGYFDQEMNQILSDPGDDTKGFFDPNTHENLTYLQLLRRCVPDPDTGLLMLQLMDKGSVLYQLSEDQSKALQAARTTLALGLFQGQSVTVWELLFSRYVPEHRRQELLRRYKAGTVSIAEMIDLLTAMVTRAEAQGHGADEAAQRSSSVKFTGLRRQVSASDLLDSGIIDTGTLAELVQGARTVQEVTQMASVKRYLDGTGVIAGVLVPCKAQPGRLEKMSIYQAMWKGILRQGTALVLLEAQAATGFLIDPVKNQKLSVDEAVASGLVGSELKNKLLSAERAVTGYTHPYTGQKMSLFQAMKQELIVRDHGIRLLEAQIATGGIIDPVHSHRVPVEVAYKRGYFDQEMNQILSDPGDDTKGFFDPNTHENLTYLQLLRRCVPDPDTGLLMLQLMDKGSEAAQRSSSVKFTGLRRQVSASDLLDSGIIDTGTLAELVQGARTVQEVTQMASVKRYLDGTGVIAGVLVPCKAQPGRLEKMSIYQAMWKGILRQGTALVLLEAQAATGFLIDPVKNQKLSVDEAVASGLVGSELHEKLLSAERAVTGYADPYTGDKISLFQAMKQELIVRDHGIRLLQAQIATGGIIDPVHSHRVPVEVAYKRGYFDQEMNQILSDPGDDTKGFFDPNTHENLTYLQLLRRCVPDPDTGL
ncbi:PLEC protein, partial [Certhia brachydactyla]|nr:PLEC protein [Certhia brachydactyla]